VIERLCEDLCRDLETRGVGARRLDLVFLRVDNLAQAVRIGLSRPYREPKHLAKLLAERLVLVDPGFGIETASLTGSWVEAITERQTVGRHVGADGADVDVSQLVDMLGVRLGQNKIFRLTPVENALPERAVRRVPALHPAQGVAWPKNLPRPAPRGRGGTAPCGVRLGGGSTMNGPVGKLARCAVYTRKSTEHNLDLAFNSLDAQREACEAYIKSQAHEGWRLMAERYDDGGLSGASLERPALQALLADVRVRRIDIVVVYKVDRLTRSLADFAKLIELFDAHDASFVSVTQSFNTSSSMGRLTLNVLLSFAQFERELIGERVRDKIAASKRKGLWVGGPVPLGYAAVDKKVVVVPAEAEAVRTIFERYLELGSVRTLAEDLAGRGIRSKPRQLSNGRTIGGGSFGVGALAYLLKNRFYVGEVAYRGEVHRGGHAPILDRALFATVQTKLAAQAVARRCRLRGSAALLTGRLFDERGNRMSPSHTNKAGARYRYYVSRAVLQNKLQAAGSIGRVPGPEIEALVMAALRNHLTAGGTRQPLPDDDRELAEHHVERVTLTPNHIKLQLRRCDEAAEARRAPSLITWEFPRLCRGGSRSLTYTAVVQRRSS
jgi:site-specific DNA recombinase